MSDVETDSAKGAEIDRLVREALGGISKPPREPTEIEASDRLEEDLNVDSLGFIEFIIEVENRLGLTFEDDQVFVEAYGDVGELVEYVNEFAERTDGA